MHLWGAGIPTSDLPIARWPALPPELQPPEGRSPNFPKSVKRTLSNIPGLKKVALLRKMRDGSGSLTPTPPSWPPWDLKLLFGIMSKARLGLKSQTPFLQGDDLRTRQMQHWNNEVNKQNSSECFIFLICNSWGWTQAKTRDKQNNAI